MRKPITTRLDDVTFSLQEPADLSFVQELGRVFTVFEKNDSGNISFGVDDGNRKRFVKVAGARTTESVVDPQDAVTCLRNAESVFRDLVGAPLVHLEDAISHGDYFALIFDWTDGECLNAHWTFDEVPKYTHPDSAYLRFKRLPLAERLRAMDDIIGFLERTHDAGYVAIDLYDGSLIYDFAAHRLTICDVDVFARKPQTNTMGRMWGSTRFMSPEEFRLGAPIDERTNVYTLGALAFMVFGDERERTREHWTASDALFDVAQRATQGDRSARYPSITAFAEAWAAVRQSS